MNTIDELPKDLQQLIDIVNAAMDSRADALTWNGVVVPRPTAIKDNA